MKRLIIADVKSNNNHGKSTGHYFAVAQNYLDLYSDCCEVKVAGGSIFRQKFGEKDLLVLPHDSIAGQNWLKNKWRVLMNCRYLFRHTSPDDIIVMQHSGALTTLLGVALFASSKNNVYLIQYDTEAIASKFKRTIYNFAKPRIHGLLCPSKRIADAYGIPSCIVTDYIYAKENKEIAEDFEIKTYDVAIVGGICRDKGVVEAAEFLANKKYKVIIAGKADDDIANGLYNICKTAPNIELRIGYLSDEDYYRYICASRFCMLNYSGVYANRSSGVVLDILFNGTPVIGHRCNALEFVERAKVGKLFDSIGDCDLSQIINKGVYNDCLKGISAYLIGQRRLKLNVMKFLHIL